VVGTIGGCTVPSLVGTDQHSYLLEVLYRRHWYQLVSAGVMLGLPEIAAVHTLVNVPVVILLP
jgi:hypothetical protein